MKNTPPPTMEKTDIETGAELLSGGQHISRDKL